ncbi:MAG: DegT/DnrJ/EryC1/StrS aminotransferase family protein, partial [Lentisphaerae bacterium]|nr:DegT/DnrJ/EryC1/StrS aminotransferase family protein [Lentisphaerota bacterium]
MKPMAKKLERANYGAAAFASSVKAEFPAVFPRVMGPNCSKYVQEVVASGLTANMVGRFEQAFAEAMGTKYFVGTPGCTNALHVLAASWPYQPGDEIIVSPISDYGTIMGLLYEHYIPVFCDTANGAPNIAAETIAPCITDRTRAILVVHKLGLPCDLDPILRLAAKHKLDV